MQATVVDDTDPRINYVTAWYHEPGQGTDYNQTVAISGNPNSAFQFTFNGTSISVYGSVPPNNTAVSTYSIDLSAPVTFTNPNLTVYTSRQLLFKSSQLSDGSHTLIVNAPDSVIGLSWTAIYFDYLTFVPSSTNTTTTTASSSSVASSPTASVESIASTSRPSNLKVILPAVLVPLLLCILLAALGLYVWRKRLLEGLRRKPTPYENPENDPSMASPTPLKSNFASPVMYERPGTIGPESPLSSCTPPDDALPEVPSMTSVAPSAAPSATPLLAGPPSATASSDSWQNIPRAALARIQHLGGGSIFGASVATETAPPPYRPRSP